MKQEKGERRMVLLVFGFLNFIFCLIPSRLDGSASNHLSCGGDSDSLLNDEARSWDDVFDFHEVDDLFWEFSQSFSSETGGISTYAVEGNELDDIASSTATTEARGEVSIIRIEVVHVCEIGISNANNDN